LFSGFKCGLNPNKGFRYYFHDLFAGEEAYSITMLLTEGASKVNAPPQINHYYELCVLDLRVSWIEDFAIKAHPIKRN
jgi:hypothetical protein